MWPWAMQGGLVYPRVELCVGNLEMSSVELSLHVQAGRTLNGWALLGMVDASTPLSNFSGLGELHGPCILWVKEYTLARL